MYSWTFVTPIILVQVGMWVFKRRGGVLTFSFSLALIPSICLAANLLASNGSTIITSFFDLPLLGDTYKIQIEEMIMFLWWYNVQEWWNRESNSIHALHIRENINHLPFRKRKNKSFRWKKWRANSSGIMQHDPLGAFAYGFLQELQNLWR